MDDRSTAEEIFEGVLLVAQRDYQEKKTKFYANFFANIAFEPFIDRALANFLLRVAERLTGNYVLSRFLLNQKNLPYATKIIEV